MTLIKSADLDSHIGLHSLALSPPRRLQPVVAPHPAETEAAELREALSGLTGELAAREMELAACRLEAIEARQEGFTAGHEAGLAEAERREGERCRLIGQALEDARALFVQSLSSLEPLSVLLAKEALDKILGDPAHHGDLAARIIRRQFALLDERSILAVEVSPEDFGDPDDFATLKERVDRPNLATVLDDGLASGECRIRLTLGVLDVGLRSQWAQLSQVLSALAEADS